MSHYVPEIDMLKIDLDTLEDADENAETIVFDIVLNGQPSAKWVEEFEILYRKRPFAIKPPVVVEGDRLRVHFLPRYQSDLQPYVDFSVGDGASGDCGGQAYRVHQNGRASRGAQEGVSHRACGSSIARCSAAVIEWGTAARSSVSSLDDLTGLLPAPEQGRVLGPLRWPLPPFQAPLALSSARGSGRPKSL